MRIYTSIWSASCILAAVIMLINPSSSSAQNGDQILDGIGETGMVARYIFKGDLKDWSRNNLHGKGQLKDLQFVNDKQFGKVLSLSGERESFVSIPQDALTDLESLSISSWVFLRSSKPGQLLFDFGKDASKHFYAAPLGTNSDNGFLASISSGKSNAKAAIAPTLELNKWVYVAVVIDIPSKLMTTYVDGKAVADTKDIPKELTAVFSPEKSDPKMLYIGKSLSSTEPNLNALLHDFRIYRVPLNKAQVAGIYSNALKGNAQSTVNVGKKEDNLQKFPANQQQLYNSYLTQVSDVNVQTSVGDLPRLPSYLNGTYKDGLKGPLVRVLWPAAMDNTAVLKPGKYTVTGKVSGTDLQPKAYITVVDAKPAATPTAKLVAFDLDYVTLKTDEHDHNTQFIQNRDKFLSTLAKTDPDAFLYMFRHAFGQKQPADAKPLGVWDSQDTKLRGHATGHYLTAIAQAYAGTGYDKALQADFAKKMEYMVNSLYELSSLSGKAKAGSSNVSDPSAVPVGPGKKAYDSDLTDAGIRTDYQNWGKGFISAYPPDQFIMLEKGAKYGGQNTSIWAPYYTLHKILAGLLDVYEVSGNKKALATATNMGDWVYARLSKLPQDTLIKMWNTYIAGEFGGMNEVMARMYRITGKQEYLKTAQLFDNIKVFFGDPEHTNGLAKNVDNFRGLHANQHIPQIVGSMEMYNVSKKPEYFKVADNFWHKVTSDYMYSIGGVAGARNPANAECFTSQPGTLYENGFSEGGQNETCGTYNMLKLTSDLFLVDQRTEYMDYYERGLYNQILASVAKDSPANTYHIGLNPGSMKQFSNGDMSGFTCCNGTAIESSTKLQNSIYFKSKDNKELFVNLYIPSSLDWTERKIKVEQSTDFPREDHTKLTIKGSGKFDLNVRVPGWATKGFFVSINGVPQDMKSEQGSYVKISRNWKNGDVVELKMPFQFHLDPVMDQQNVASLFYGPVLLAAQEPEARKEWRKVTLDAADISKSITGDPSTLQFNIGDVVFKPFYETYGRHSVYLDVTLK
jgi:DUF1680 family protein